MSKKIAAGAQAIVLDVKVGLGAFMETLEAGRVLAETMVLIAKMADRKAIALLSDMNQPLGYAVGNVLEVQEAIETLHGSGPQDFREHCLVVAGHMLALAGDVPDEKDGYQKAEEAITSGRAWQRFRDLVIAQGGDVVYIDQPERLPRAALVETVGAPRSGFLSEINARVVGEASVILGAGRTKKEDPIDHAVGLVIHRKVGDYVETGQALFTIHANRPDLLDEARQNILAAHQWSAEPVAPLPLFYEVIKP